MYLFASQPEESQRCCVLAEMVEDIKQSIVNCTVCEIDSPVQSNESQLTRGISREKVDMDLFSWKEKEYLNSRLQGTWFQSKYTPMGFPLE